MLGYAGAEVEVETYLFLVMDLITSSSMVYVAEEDALIAAHRILSSRLMLPTTPPNNILNRRNTTPHSPSVSSWSTAGSYP